MDILNADLQAQLIQLLQTIITGVISIGSIYAVILINKYKTIAQQKIEVMKDENAKNKLNTTLERVQNLLVTNITSTENTLKQELLNATQDGKLTKEDFEKLKTNVIDKTIAQLGTDATDVLISEVGDINDYIGQKTEEVLANLKIDVNSSVK